MDFLAFLHRRPSRPGSLVLALGGGGARGLAHIGVLSVLEEHDIGVAGIAGSSAGAVVGAMWLVLGSAGAVHRRWQEFLAAGFPRSLPDVPLTGSVTTRDNLLLQFARRLKRQAIVALALERRSFLEHADLEEAIAFLVPDRRAEEFKTPFAAVCTDFATGEPVALRRGPLRQVLAASSAIPAVVPPFTVDGRALLDGGTVADVPVMQARSLGGRPVLAVDVGEDLPADDASSLTLPRALLRSSAMTHRALRGLAVGAADLSIHPEVGRVHWSEFGRLEELVAAGRACAEAHATALRDLAQRQIRHRGPTLDAAAAP
jgi:NTE family protein